MANSSPRSAICGLPRRLVGRISASLAILLVCLLAGPGAIPATAQELATAQEEADDRVSGNDIADETVFEDTISVRLLTFRIRVIDPRGEALDDLEPADFRATIAGEPVPVVAADWIPAVGLVEPGLPTLDRDSTLAPDLDPDLDPDWVLPEPEPRRIVVFVQSAMERLRLVGQRRLLREFDRILDSFAPSDEIAVVSYGSRLELRLDFSRDRRAVREAVETAALRFGTAAHAEPAPGDASLFDFWDPRAAADAAEPETGLRILGEMLERVPGEKLVLFLGWGLGRFGATGVTWRPDFAPAIRAFRRARVPVHAIDISDSKRHSLEIGLQALAGETGGVYYRTMELTGPVVRRVIANLEGHYLLAVDGEIYETLRARHPNDAFEIEVEGRGELSGPPLPLE